MFLIRTVNIQRAPLSLVFMTVDVSPPVHFDISRRKLAEDNTNADMRAVPTVRRDTANVQQKIFVSSNVAPTSICHCAVQIFHVIYHGLRRKIMTE